MKEIWKVIPGYDYPYEVSNMGRVKFPKTRRYPDGKISIGWPDSQGYLSVALKKNKKKVSPRVHRLVAQVFLPNPNNLPEIDHKNINKLDNRVENLRWCTRTVNARNKTSNRKYRCVELNRVFNNAGEAIEELKLKCKTRDISNAANPKAKNRRCRWLPLGICRLKKNRCNVYSFFLQVVDKA